MLKIEKLSVHYQGNVQPSLTEVDLTLKKGEICCIVGESGSGKSTILKTILGALPKNAETTGCVSLFDKKLLNQTEVEWQKLRGSVVSIIFQDSSATLNPIRKIGSQYIEYILQHEKISVERARDKAEAMLAKMQLKQVKRIMNSYPHQLSGGMCQRVGIAMGMTFQPKLLLADEPTSALDVLNQRNIVEELLHVRATFNSSILLVTHNLALAAHMADQIVVLKKGKIVDCGEPAKVIHFPQSDYTKKLVAAIPEL